MFVMVSPSWTFSIALHVIKSCLLNEHLCFILASSNKAPDNMSWQTQAQCLIGMEVLAVSILSFAKMALYTLTRQGVLQDLAQSII